MEKKTTFTSGKLCGDRAPKWDNRVSLEGGKIGADLRARVGMVKISRIRRTMVECKRKN